MPDPAHEKLKSGVSSVLLSALGAQRWTYKNKSIHFEDFFDESDLASESAKHAQPDGSLRVEGGVFPFLVAEIANSQTEFSLNKKVHHWTHGSRQHLKYILMFRIIGERVLLSIDRLEARATPTAANPHEYTMVADHMLVEEEIYPEHSDEYFTITLADVLPKQQRADPTIPDKQLVMSLSSFYELARQAVRAKQTANRPPSDRDPNERSVPSPTDPRPDAPSRSSSSSHNDRRSDKDFEME
ncbi:MAG: hypothetical protein Q9226_009365 [Calogaya cf. arnoldii]